jgi:hypothetical protein
MSERVGHYPHLPSSATGERGGVRIENVHARALPADAAAAAGSLIDGLAGKDDRLWPHDRWPPMRFEGGLREGSEGGHGPIRYRVVEHRPGRSVRFRFTAPAGLVGEHGYELESGNGTVLLRHTLSARAGGRMRWQWPLLFGPLHDALIEDSLDRAAAAVSATPYVPARWPPRARALRWLLRGLI